MSSREFDKFYIKLYDSPNHKYLPTLAAIEEMRVGDEVITFWNNEGGSHLRKITRVYRPNGATNRREVYITLDNGNNPQLGPLNTIPATWVVPTKHGLFIDYIEGI